MRAIAVIILFLIVVSIFAAPVLASDITITVGKEQIHTKMVLSLHQNMTEFPNQTSSLTMSRDSNLSMAFTEALRKANPTASISDLVLTVNSTKTWLNLTATMSISGVYERRGDTSSVSTTWKAFNISADLRSGNFSYNAVGRRYLRPVIDFYVNASKFENKPNATIQAVTFFVNGTQSVAGEVAANQVGNATVLDFRSLAVTLEQWRRTYDLANNTTTWRYTPMVPLAASVKATRFNRTLEIFSDYSYNAEVSVPGLARAAGNTLLIDVGTGQKEWIMAGIVVLAIGLALATQLMFRARKKAAMAKWR